MEKTFYLLLFIVVTNLLCTSCDAFMFTTYSVSLSNVNNYSCFDVNSEKRLKFFSPL